MEAFGIMVLPNSRWCSVNLHVVLCDVLKINKILFIIVTQ